MLGNRKLIRILSVIPITILYLVLFYGIFISMVRSFGIYESIGLDKVTLRYIIDVIMNREVQFAIIRTFVVSFVEALISVILAVLISVYLIKNSIIHHKVLYTPIAVPHIVVAMMMILLFSQNGFISRIFYHLGIIRSSQEFNSILNDKYNIGVIVAYVFKGTAYVLSVIYLIMKKNDYRYFEVAKLMNVRYGRYVRDILLPNSLDSLITSFLILFSFSFGAYELPYMIGNTSNKLLPVIAYEKYLSPNLYDKPIFLSINLVMIVIGIIIIIIYKKVLDNGYFKKQKHYI